MPVLEKAHNTTRTTNSEPIIISGFRVENVAQNKFFELSLCDKQITIEWIFLLSKPGLLLIDT